MLKENFEIIIEDLTIKIGAVEDQQKQLVARIEKISTIFIFLLVILIALSMCNLLSVLEINEGMLEMTENIKETNKYFKDLLDISKSDVENNYYKYSWLRGGLLCLISCVPFRGRFEPLTFSL